MVSTIKLLWIIIKNDDLAARAGEEDSAYIRHRRIVSRDRLTIILLLSWITMTYILPTTNIPHFTMKEVY